MAYVSCYVCVLHDGCSCLVTIRWLLLTGSWLSCCGSLVVSHMVMVVLLWFIGVSHMVTVVLLKFIGCFTCCHGCLVTVHWLFLIWLRLSCYGSLVVSHRVTVVLLQFISCYMWGQMSCFISVLVSNRFVVVAYGYMDVWWLLTVVASIQVVLRAFFFVS